MILPRRPRSRQDTTCARSGFGWLAGAACVLIALAVTPHAGHASTDTDLEFHNAVAAYGDGDLARAREGFLQVLAEDPDDASARHYLALIAIQQGNTQEAISQLEQVVATNPSLLLPRVDLAAQYLKLQRNEDALEQADAALAIDADDARANLYQGIALYRLNAFEDAIASLKRARELDPALSSESHYYIGLSHVYLGSADAASAAFETAASSSPQSPHGRSATSLQRTASRSARRWSALATVGLEYNDNLRLSPDDDTSAVLLPGVDTGKTKSGAGVVRLQGQVAAVDSDLFTWRFGYDGYGQFYWNDDRVTLTSGQNFAATDLSQQTHVGWTNATLNTSLASFSLRYDYSYTWIDLTEQFRSIQRVAPTTYVPVSDWGLFVAYYQFLYYDYKIAISNPAAFDRTGPQHSVGGQQFVFLPDPFNYVVLGALYTHFDSDGTEFRHNGVDVSLGGEVGLPFAITLGALFTYSHRDYTEPSAVTGELPPRTKRKDNEYEISFSLDRTFASRFNVSLAGSYGTNVSNIDNFDIDRFIIGTYLQYAF